MLGTSAEAGLAGRDGIFHDRPMTSVADTTQSMLSRCLPGVTGSGPLRTAGLAPAADEVARLMLGRFSGSVWVDRSELANSDVMLIDMPDIGVCRVVAPTLRPNRLAPFVDDVLRAAPLQLDKKFFVPGDGGSFKAIYKAATAADVRVRVSAKRRGSEGLGYAIFTVVTQP